jgi:hypothetical protein
MSQVLLWGSIILYSEKMRSGDESNVDDDERSEQIMTETLYSIGQAISSVWIISVALFFMTCRKEYRKSFWSTSTARTYTKQCWDWQMNQDPRVADESIVKVRRHSLSLAVLSLSLSNSPSFSASFPPPLKIFVKNHSAYKHFESEVSAFVSDNWERWNHEKPRFFTTKFIASIPFSVLSKEIRELVVNDLHAVERKRRLSKVKKRKVEVETTWRSAIRKTIQNNKAAAIMKQMEVAGSD